MQWSDEGIVLSSRSHGETSAIVELLTREHGRHLGLVRGGRSKRLRPVLQPGNVVTGEWRARLSEHLGQYSLELIEPHAAAALDDPLRLAALTSLCGLARLLPERDPHPQLYEMARLILAQLERSGLWTGLMVRWELKLLEDLGFGLDLERCAATGQTERLAYVSPKTGRAVSEAAGMPYSGRLLVLPTFLQASPSEQAPVEDVLVGLQLTGFFLARYVFGPRGTEMPEARNRLIALLQRTAQDRPAS